MKILHVEDNKGWRVLIARLLPNDQVDSFEGMNKAKEAFTQQSYDLVICDGTIDQPEDGRIWATGLSQQGQAVLVISGGKDPRIVPYLDKINFDRDAFLQFVNQFRKEEHNGPP